MLAALQLRGMYFPFPLNIPAINSPYGYWFQALLKILHFRFKNRYMQKNVTKLATLQAQPKPRAFHPYPGLQQAEAFIVHLLMQKKIPNNSSLGGKKNERLQLVLEAERCPHAAPLGQPGLAPRSRSSRGVPHIFSKYQGAMKRLMKQEKPASKAKGVTAALQSFGQQKVHLHPSL